MLELNSLPFVADLLIKEAILELGSLPFEGDLLKTLHQS
jgi:hypothetical protein